MKVATLTTASANKKLTKDPRARMVSVTRAAQESCPGPEDPSPCPFYGKGCYAESGRSGIHTSRVNSAAVSAGLSALGVAEAEAAVVRADWPRDGRPLRLHEVGDCKIPEAARAVSDAVTEAQVEGAGVAFTYTHAWRSVPRSAWGPVSVLASVETPGEAVDARSRGYAPAMVVASFEAGVELAASVGLRGVACPEQTGAALDCASCKLCFRADRLHELRVVILFVAHGSGSKKVRAAVEGKLASERLDPETLKVLAA